MIELLRESPRPPHSKHLKGRLRNPHRVRSGNYRMIYQVFDDRLVICVIAVGHRRDTYRR